MIKKIFDKKELKNLALASFVLGFIFSFRKWGYGETFIFSVGIYNLIFTEKNMVFARGCPCSPAV